MGCAASANKGENTTVLVATNVEAGDGSNPNVNMNNNTASNVNVNESTNNQPQQQQQQRYEVAEKQPETISASNNREHDQSRDVVPSVQSVASSSSSLLLSLSPELDSDPEFDYDDSMCYWTEYVSSNQTLQTRQTEENKLLINDLLREVNDLLSQSALDDSLRSLLTDISSVVQQEVERHERHDAIQIHDAAEDQTILTPKSYKLRLRSLLRPITNDLRSPLAARLPLFWNSLKARSFGYTEPISQEDIRHGITYVAAILIKQESSEAFELQSSLLQRLESMFEIVANWTLVGVVLGKEFGQVVTEAFNMVEPDSASDIVKFSNMLQSIQRRFIRPSDSDRQLDPIWAEILINELNHLFHDLNANVWEWMPVDVIDAEHRTLWIEPQMWGQRTPESLLRRAKDVRAGLANACTAIEYLLKQEAAQPVVSEVKPSPALPAFYPTATAYSAGSLSGDSSTRLFDRFGTQLEWNSLDKSWRFNTTLGDIFDHEVVMFDLYRLNHWTVNGSIDLDMNAAIWTKILDVIIQSNAASNKDRADWREYLKSYGILVCPISSIPSICGRRSVFVSHRWTPRGGVAGMPIAYLQQYCSFAAEVKMKMMEQGTAVPGEKPDDKPGAMKPSEQFTTTPLWVWIDNLSVPQVPASAFAVPHGEQGPDGASGLDKVKELKSHIESAQAEKDRAAALWAERKSKRAIAANSLRRAIKWVCQATGEEEAKAAREERKRALAWEKRREKKANKAGSQWAKAVEQATKTLQDAEAAEKGLITEDILIRFRCNQAAIATLLWRFGDLAAACELFLVHTPLLFNDQTAAAISYVGHVNACEKVEDRPKFTQLWVDTLRKKQRTAWAVESLRAWLKALGSTDWHQPLPVDGDSDGFDALNGIVQFPFSMPPYQRLDDPYEQAKEDVNQSYHGAFLNSFRSENCYARRAWCMAEFFARLIHRGSEGMCDSARWIGSIMNACFEPEIATCFQSTPLLHAETLVERCVCSHVQWRDRPTSASSASASSSANEFRNQLIGSLLSVEGLVTSVANATAARPNDLVAVIRSLYRLVCQAAGIKSESSAGAKDDMSIPAPLSAMLDFCIAHRSPSRGWPILLDESDSPLWPYLRWSQQYFVQDFGSAFMLERLLNQAWDRSKKSIRDQRPAWTKWIPQSDQNADDGGQGMSSDLPEETANGSSEKPTEQQSQPILMKQLPEGTPGFRALYDTQYLFQKHGLDLAKIFVTCHPASQLSLSTGLRGMVVCRHKRCPGVTEADHSQMHFCLQAAQDQINSVIDPLNLLIDATISEVSAWREDREFRHNWHLSREKWEELFRLADWMDPEETPAAPAPSVQYDGGGEKFPFPPYKRLTICYPLSSVRVPRGAFHVEGLVVSPLADTNPPLDEIDLTQSLKDEAFWKFSTQFGAVTHFSVRLHPHGPHRAEADAWSAESGWRQESSSADGSVKVVQHMGLYE